MCECAVAMCLCRYFQCPPKHGLFAPLPKVEKLADSGPPPDEGESSGKEGGGGRGRVGDGAGSEGREGLRGGGLIRGDVCLGHSWLSAPCLHNGWLNGPSQGSWLPYEVCGYEWVLGSGVGWPNMGICRASVGKAT